MLHGIKNQILKQLFRRHPNHSNFVVVVIFPDMSLSRFELFTSVANNLAAFDNLEPQTFAPFEADGTEFDIQQKADCALLYDCDLIVTMGPACTFAAQRVLREQRKKTPILFTGITKPMAESMVNTSRFGNKSPDIEITGVLSHDENYTQRIDDLVHIAPNARNMLIVSDPIQRMYEGDSYNFNQIQNTLKQHNINSFEMKVTEPSEIISELQNFVATSGKPDLIFFKKDPLILANIKNIIVFADETKIPLYSSDSGSVREGAAIGSAHQDAKIGKMLSDLARMILNKEAAAAELPLLEYTQDFEIVYNYSAMKKQGFEFTTQAINWAREKGKILTACY